MRNIHRAVLAVDRLPAGMVATCTVETRKASNHTQLEHDEHKLRALTDPHVRLAYTIGELLVLDRTGVMLSGGGPTGRWRYGSPSGWTTQALLRSREGADQQRVLAGVAENPRFPGQNLKLLWMKVPYRST